MNRGDVWWVSFDPSIGGEIRKSGPAVIVSNDASNRALNRVQVVPLTYTPLDERTVGELRNRAEELGIAGRSTMNKSELVAAIRRRQ